MNSNFFPIQDIWKKVAAKWSFLVETLLILLTCPSWVLFFSLYGWRDRLSHGKSHVQFTTWIWCGLEYVFFYRNILLCNVLVSAIQQGKSANIHTYPLPLEPPTLPSSHPSRSSHSSELSLLRYTAGSRQLSVLRMVMSTLISQFIPPSLPPPHHVQLSILYVCFSIPALQVGSSIPFFYIPHALIYNICFSISDLLQSVWQILGPSTSLPWLNFNSFFMAK